MTKKRNTAQKSTTIVRKEFIYKIYCVKGYVRLYLKKKKQVKQKIQFVKNLIDQFFFVYFFRNMM